MNTMYERWKYIPEYDGIYMVSDFGNMKCMIDWNINFHPKLNLIGRPLHPYKSYSKRNSVYRIVTLNGNPRHDMFIHRLVAMCFIDNPENKPYINHIDGNGLNNYYKNLEWCTPLENQSHASKIGLYPVGEKQFCAELSNEDVENILILHKGGSMNIKQIAEKYGIHPSHMGRVISRKKFKLNQPCHI